MKERRNKIIKGGEPERWWSVQVRVGVVDQGRQNAVKQFCLFGVRVPFFAFAKKKKDHIMIWSLHVGSTTSDSPHRPSFDNLKTEHFFLMKF